MGSSFVPPVRNTPLRDAFGDILFPVNGRIWFFNSSLADSKFRMSIGGSIFMPTEYSMEMMGPYTTNGVTFSGCKTKGNATGMGLDIFSRVDTTGTLWVGDWVRIVVRLALLGWMYGRTHLVSRGKKGGNFQGRERQGFGNYMLVFQKKKNVKLLKLI